MRHQPPPITVTVIWDGKVIPKDEWKNITIKSATVDRIINAVVTRSEEPRNDIPSDEQQEIKVHKVENNS